jgi:membrane protein
MADEEAPGQDWRSVETRAADHVALGTARKRAAEPGRGRGAKSPEEIPGRGWVDIIWRVIGSIPQDRVSATAGGVAFFALLAVFPGLATVVSLYGLFADVTTMSRHLTLLTGILPSGVLDLLAQEMGRIAGKSTPTLSTAFLVSIAIAFWSANSGVVALFDALNVIYKERERRSLVRLYGTTFLFTLGAIGFGVAATTAVVVIPVLLNLVGLSSLSDRLLSIARWPILLILVVLGLALIYRYGPSRHEAKWRWVTWGNALATLLWMLGSMAFSWYVASFDSYNRTYGSLGAGVGFMTWMWLSIVIVLLGAELNSEMERQTARDTTEGQPKPLGSREAYAADTVGKAISQ